jgi:hypothetical protein
MKRRSGRFVVVAGFMTMGASPALADPGGPQVHRSGSATPRAPRQPAYQETTVHHQAGRRSWLKKLRLSTWVQIQGPSHNQML